MNTDKNARAAEAKALAAYRRRATRNGIALEAPTSSEAAKANGTADLRLELERHRQARQTRATAQRKTVSR